MVLGLPPIPPELKSITPYIQRAHELAKADPVIAYWCTLRSFHFATRVNGPPPGAYYAAQHGIALKLKESAARRYLSDLLNLLERMMTEIGPNDAVHDEAASAAYIENFALRIFVSADNEDRSGSATRCVSITCSDPPP